MPKYVIRPTEHGLSEDFPSIHLPTPMADWPMKNVDIDQHSVKKRWGYGTADRTLDRACNTMAIYQEKDTTRNTLYLTDRDLILRETASGKTWSYKTQIYNTGSISSCSSASTTVEGTDTPDWVDATKNRPKAGDFFALVADLTPAGEEPLSAWTEIASITDDDTLELTENYNGSGTSGAYIIRMAYTTPSGEKWNYAIVDDKFCFTNGNTIIQYWDGADYAEHLDSSTEVVANITPRNARYCIEYANRLFIADYGATRDPLGIAWSAEDDPTDWTSATSGAAQLLDTSSWITGLGKVGANLIVYRRESIIVGARTSIPTVPVNFGKDRMGIGCIAPASIINFLGINAFLGRDDFYVIETDMPVPIGESIRHKFFDIVGDTEAQFVWGQAFPRYYKCIWWANTSEGKYGFVWDYKSRQWSVHRYAHDITGAGVGAI